MIDPCPPRFQRHNHYRHNRVDGAQQFLSGYGFDFEVRPREAPALDLRLNTACLGNTAVIYMQTGASAELAHQADDVFWLVLPVRDAIEASAGGDSMVLGPSRGAVTSARRRFSLRTTRQGTNF